MFDVREEVSHAPEVIEVLFPGVPSGDDRAVEHVSAGTGASTVRGEGETYEGAGDKPSGSGRDVREGRVNVNNRECDC